MNQFKKPTVQQIDTQKRKQAEHAPGGLLPTLLAWSAGMVAGASAITHLGQASLNKMAANGQFANVEGEVASINLGEKIRATTENVGKDLKKTAMENGDDILRVVEELEENKDEQKRKEAEIAQAKKLKDGRGAA